QQRRQVDPFGQRVDRHRFLRAGHLHDAEDRPIGALAHELGIDGDELRALLTGAEGGERVAVGDQVHRRGYSIETAGVETWYGIEGVIIPAAASAPPPITGARSRRPVRLA